MDVNYLSGCRPYVPITQSRKWAESALPSVYDESLSLYELMGKLLKSFIEMVERMNCVGENSNSVLLALAQLKEAIGQVGPVRSVKPAIVSFIDDDCRVEAHTILLPLKQSLNIPLAVACPPGNIGVTDGYMNVGQLQEMVANGVTVACHHWTQTNMNRYEDIDAYAKDLDDCLSAFEGWGISGVNTVCYPQGIYIDNLMPVVRDRFKLGFGVFSGINEVPLESYFMHRCELFPSKGNFTIVDAKDMVDRVAREGGWLVFMTHSWYPTFDPVKLTELVEYIKEAGIEIVGLDEGLELVGNKSEVGIFRKSLEHLTAPYFVEDANGNVWSDGYDATPLILREAKVINQNGIVVTVSSKDTEYVVTDKVPVSGPEVVVSGWASDGNALYVMYDADGNRKQVRYSTVSYADGGEYMDNLVVPVPDGVTHIAVAGYFRKQMPGVIMQQACTVTDEQIAQAVEDYLQENPNESGVTIYDDGNGNVSIMSMNPRALTFSSKATGENPVFYRGYVQAVTKTKFTSTAVGALQEE